MSAQVQFFKKNFIDLDVNNVTITVTDSVATNTGSAFVDFMRNRKNTSSWLTTGSADSGNTTLTFDYNSPRAIDHVFLIGMNFASYTVQYWNGSSFVDFSPVVNVSGNTETTRRHQFSTVTTSQVQVVVNSTIVADAEKQMAQFIITELLGRLEAWPIIKPQLSRNKRVTRMLSGKKNIIDSVGFYRADLDVKILSNDTDLTLIETIYNSVDGVLFYPSGGDETQFSSVREGWRTQDIYLVRPTSEYRPEWFKGLYVSGIRFKMTLEESIT